MLAIEFAWVHSPGSYARWKTIAAAQVFAVPDNVSCETAAAALFQGMTAHYLACSTYPLEAGSTCVIHSAAGGVGLLLTQIAKLRGAVVIGAVSTPAKAAVAAANGADHVAVYANGDLVDITKRATGGRGVDVVYDAVGKDTFEQSLACLRVRGLLALYGEASGLVPPLDVRQLLTAGAVYLTRTGLSYYATTEAERRQRGDDVLRWLAEARSSRASTAPIVCKTRRRPIAQSKAAAPSARSCWCRSSGKISPLRRRRHQRERRDLRRGLEIYGLQFSRILELVLPQPAENHACCQ